MKIWDKGFAIEKRIEAFTVGEDPILDLKLAPYDVQASMAHARMLGQVGIISPEEADQLVAGLEQIAKEIAADDFTIEAGIEDVHTQLEILLTRRLGPVGKKIHAGRSRNDQVLVALKLFFRDELADIARLVVECAFLLLKKSDLHKEDLMPGYTHLQAAMPSSFGMWFAGYAETLADDLLLLRAAFEMVDQNPLGSAAGFGNSFPLDRDATTRDLGFSGLHVNSVAAQMSRGRAEWFVSTAIAAVSSTLSRAAGDLCLWSGPDFGFFKLPDAFTTGSSIMPHKKNPDVFELVRAKCNRLTTLPGQIDRVLANLSSGYHRDLQELKGIIVEGIETVKSCLSIFSFSLDQIEVGTSLLEQKKYRYVFSVERVNALVMQGMTFRDAYRQVGQEIADGTFSGEISVPHTHVGSIGNLGNEHIYAKLLKRFDFVPHKG